MSIFSKIVSAFKHETQAQEGVVKIKWGYVPCDYDHYIKLKEVCKHFYKARSTYHQWLRWMRKAPQNRVTKRAIRNDKGQKCGTAIIGPMQEPKLNESFIKTTQYSTNYPSVQGGGWKYSKTPVPVVKVELVDTVWKDYQNCYPVAAPEHVKKLQLTKTQVEEMLAHLEGR